MITPNLMVADMAKSVAFYQDVIGLKVTMAVTGDKKVLTDGTTQNAVFVTLEDSESTLMLQTKASLSEELPEFASARVSLWGTVYFRGIDPEPVRGRVEVDAVIREIATSWYHMKELCLKDPDGHMIFVGQAA